MVHQLAQHHHERDHADRERACPAAGACAPGRALREHRERDQGEQHQQQVQHLEAGEARDLAVPVEPRLTISSTAPIAAISGPIGMWVPSGVHRTTKFTSLPGTTTVFTISSRSNGAQLVGGARELLELLAAAPSAGAASRSTSLPFTCTTSWISSRASSAGSASRPRLLPHAPAGHQLVHLRAEVRGEREDQRGRRGDREAHVAGRRRLALPVDLVRRAPSRRRSPC